MHFSRALLALSICAFSSASAIPPSPGLDQLQIGAEGFYNASSEHSLHARQSVPPECRMDNRIAYRYVQITNAPEPACLAYLHTHSRSCAGNGGWDAQNFEQIQQSVAEQVTKDGFTETSRVGPWLAGWRGFTTAVADRQAVSNFFSLGLVFADQHGRWGEYWFRYGSDDLYTVKTEGGC